MKLIHQKIYYKSGILNFLLIAFVIVLTLETSFAKDFYSKKGLAIEGYDVVSYFVDDDAIMGNAEYQHEWGGSIWQFSNKNNLELFKKNPKKYAPKYGGYCAWAAASNYVYQSDPEAYTIHEGRLYLNASKSIRLRWLLNKTSNIKEADKNWPELVKTLK